MNDYRNNMRFFKCLKNLLLTDKEESRIIDFQDFYIQSDEQVLFWNVPTEYDVIDQLKLRISSDFKYIICSISGGRRSETRIYTPDTISNYISFDKIFLVDHAVNPVTISFEFKGLESPTKLTIYYTGTLFSHNKRETSLSPDLLLDSSISF